MPAILMLAYLCSGLAAAPLQAGESVPEARHLPSELDFLQGCWGGEINADGTRVEEIYTSAKAGELLGALRTSRNGKTLFFEFLRITAAEEDVWLLPQPSGKPPDVRFRLVTLETDRAVFENAEHDFPRRIEYRRLPDDQLLTRVAGEIDGEPVLDEYRTRRFACGD